ncbi:MAG: TonB-dependent receptor [Candidatus Baltobacteraceae bacterium]
MLAFVLAALVAPSSPSPSPSATATPLPVIATVRVATGSRETLHRLPVAASVFDAAALANHPAMTGDAALGSLPGFDRDRSNSAFTNYGQLRVSFTGAGNDRGLVLADGVPAQDGFGGQIDWAAYPTDDLVRAELLRGAGSALYGAGAIGGVLQLDTFGPAGTTESGGTLTIAGGTHGTVHNYARVSVPLSHVFSASLSLSQTQESYFDLPPAYASPIDLAAQSQNSMASIRLRYAASSATYLEFGYRGAWDDQQEGRSNYDFSRRLNQNSLGFVHSYGHASLSLMTYVRNAFVTNRADTYPTAPGALRYTQYVPTNEIGAVLMWTSTAAHSELTVRGDGRAVGGDSTQLGSNGTLQAEGTGSQRLDGVAVQETFTLERASVVAGVREDGVSTSTNTPRTDRAVSPRVAARYDLSKHLAFRISDGAGFRGPFLNELVRGYQIGPVKYLPNPALIPERSSSLSAGLDWSTAQTHIALDAIHTYVNDAISFLTVSPTVQMRGNIARTQTDGETLTITRELSPATRLQAFGTSQYARVTGGDPATIGKRLAYIPSVSAGLNIDTTTGTTGVGLSVTYAGPTYADDLNTQPLGTALLVGAHLSLPLQNSARVVLDFENATGARYLSSVDRYGPPATVTLGLTVPVSGSR